MITIREKPRVMQTAHEPIIKTVKWIWFDAMMNISLRRLERKLSLRKQK